MVQIEIYTTPYCPYCIAAKRLLSEKDVTFTEIDVARDGDVLRLSVSDDGPGPRGAPTAAAGAGVGLANTQERLLQLYGERQSLRLVPRPEGGTTAVVELPFRLGSAGERSA